MADNSVFISGVASGAFADAYAGLPEWATEQTAAKIESVLSKSYNTQNKILVQLIKMASGGNLDPSKLKQLNAELETLAKQVSEDVKIGKRKKTQQEDQERQRKRSIEDEDKKHKEIAAITSTWGTLQKVSGSIIGVFGDNINTFDKLYASGINVTAGFDGVTSGFQALQQLSAITGVRYTELSESIVKFGTAINAFSLGKFAKTVGAASVELRQYGFNTKEAAELTGQYLEIQRGYTNAAAKSQEEVTGEVINYGKRITQLSQATGMARNTLLQNIDALSKSVEATILNAQTNSGATQSTLDFIGSFQDKNVGQAFLRMMTDSIKPLNTTFQSFQKLGMGGFGQQLMNFTQSLRGLDPKEAQKRTAEFFRTNQGALDSMIRQANMYRQLGLNAEADTVLSLITGLKQQANAYTEVTDEQRATADRSAEASKALQSEFENFKAQLQIFMGPLVPLLNGATKLLSAINTVFEYVGKAISGIETFVGKLFGKDMQGTLVPAIGSLIAVVAGVVSGMIALRGAMLGINSAMLVAKAGIFNPKNILRFISGKEYTGAGGETRGRGGAGGAGGGARSGRGGGGGGVRGGRGGGGGGGVGGAIGGVLGGIFEGLGKAGPMLKSLGAGAGGMIQGLLEGIAAGIGAFKPQVLVGAAVLSASIAILGAGISAAAWMLGKTLPTLAEGFQAFATLDGNALGEVGKGIAILAGGLIAFAGTSTLATAGNVLSNIGDGIVKLFGGKTIMDQLQAFANLGPNLLTAGVGLTQLSSGLAGIAATIASITGVDKLTTIINAINTLDVKKAAAFASLGGTLTPTVASSAASVPNTPAKTATVETGAPAPKVTESAPVSSPEIKPAPGTGLADGALARQTVVLEQLLDTVTNLLSVNKDILKYTRAQS